MFQKYSCQVSKPSDVSGGIFSKRVTDDDDRSNTFFLASCSEYCVVTMEYRASDHAHWGSACISSESALRELSAAAVRPLIFFCAS